MIHDGYHVDAIIGIAKAVSIEAPCVRYLLWRSSLSTFRAGEKKNRHMLSQPEGVGRRERCWPRSFLCSKRNMWWTWDMFLESENIQNFRPSVEIVRGSANRTSARLEWWAYIHISAEGCWVCMFLAIDVQGTPEAAEARGPANRRFGSVSFKHIQTIQTLHLDTWSQQIPPSQNKEASTFPRLTNHGRSSPKSINLNGQPCSSVNIIAPSCTRAQGAKETVTKHGKRPWTVYRIYKKGLQTDMRLCFNQWLAEWLQARMRH